MTIGAALAALLLLLVGGAVGAGPAGRSTLATKPSAPRSNTSVEVVGSGAGANGALLLDRGGVVFDLKSRRKTLVARGGQDPAWSPEGSRIAYSRGEWIWIKVLDHRAPRRFVTGAEPTWAPDGKSIAYTDGRRTGGIVVRSLTGDTRPVRSNDSSGGCVAEFGQPDWSPVHLAEIVYTGFYTCPVVSAFYSTEIQVTGPRWGTLYGPFSDGPEDPIFSPDGERVAFYSSQDPEGLAIVHRPAQIRTRLHGYWYPHDWQPLCTLRGSMGPDRIQGRRTADLACGFRGDDQITGGAGRDRLFGEQGDDRIGARDGEFDIVGCGSGQDRVLADEGDLVGFDCEQVSRR